LSARRKSDRFRRLLSHGFFAPELPPCFVSTDIAKYREYIWKEIVALPSIKETPLFYNYKSELCNFYYPRFGKPDRKHGVYNPIIYLCLSKIIADNYVNIRKIAKRSGLSSSPPVFDWDGSRSFVRPSIDMRDDFRVDLSSRREEFVTADIRAFFHSIYTHSIPWAIYGKEWAKQNREDKHFGNLLDRLCRNGQDGQTTGLPVGPDTSRLLSEIVASAVDERIRESLSLSSRDASRYIDDYTLSGRNGEAGERLIAKLREAVNYFELELNSEKSKIYPTSVRYEAGWKQAVRKSIHSSFPDHNAVQLFFYEIGRICEYHSDINVEKYAIQNARSALVGVVEWKKLQSTLINAYRRNPSLISVIVEIFIFRHQQYDDIDVFSLTDFIDNRISRLSQENRLGEIIWLLFLAIRLKIKVNSKSLEVVLRTDNSLIAILVTYADYIGLIEGAIDRTNWDKSLHASGLRSSMWLYAYETAMIGINSDAFLSGDQYFSLLKKKGIRFLNTDIGFTSLSTTLNERRGDNLKKKRLREDFAKEFDFNCTEIDEIMPDNLDSVSEYDII
jgi:hypothetical protein